MAHLISLDEAAKLIPGATARTLRRRIRQGLLTAYRPGKSYLTTEADVRRMVEACRVPAKVASVVKGKEPPLPLGLTEIDLANMALNAVLTRLPSKKEAALN